MNMFVKTKNVTMPSASAQPRRGQHRSDAAKKKPGDALAAISESCRTLLLRLFQETCAVYLVKVCVTLMVGKTAMASPPRQVSDGRLLAISREQGFEAEIKRRLLLRSCGVLWGQGRGSEGRYLRSPRPLSAELWCLWPRRSGEDLVQEAVLAIHIQRHTYDPAEACRRRCKRNCLCPPLHR
jgi:hypothetical protein